MTTNTSNRRIFNKQSFYSELVPYSSKDEAKTLVDQIKSLDKAVRARIIEKSDGFFVYFDEKSFNDIKKGKFQDIIKKIEKESLNKPKSNQKLTKQSKLDEDAIISRQITLPQFLMNRLSKKASSILQKSVLEIQKSSKKDLEQELDIIRSEQVKFDIRYEHEKEMLNYINRMAKVIENRIREYADQESEIFMKANVIQPIKRGEFQKQLSKLEKKGVDQVAYLIYKKLGRKTNRYPYKQNHLIDRIRNYLTNEV
ncbi:MAG: hypothetical protein JW776_00055 [Candidatus Lokiarchaeota archaeon]|nr:hypothetical protein [Candidatus Lokiarchaeota archaeon]